MPKVLTISKINVFNELSKRALAINDPLETPWHTDFIIFLYFQIGKPSP